MSRPSRNGELAEIASSSGSTGLSLSQTRTARSIPVDPEVHVQAEGVVPPGHVFEALLHAPVVLGVDYRLFAVVRPGMGPCGAERGSVLRREGEQGATAFALAGERVVYVRARARDDLDLRGDQLTGDRMAQERIGRRGRAELLVARRQFERTRIQDRELLLHPDGEVPRGLECLLRSV